MDYVKEALRTENYPRIDLDKAHARLLHSAMGLTTESGEFMDAVKKCLIYGKPLDKVNLSEELGDMLWYMAIALDTLGLDFDSVMRQNIAKLRARYPDKFTEEKALTRDLEAERDVLAGFRG